MIKIQFHLILSLLGLSLTASSVDSAWTIERGPAKGLPGEYILVLLDDRKVAEFIFGEGQFKPYLGLFTADGQRLTNSGMDSAGQTRGRFPHHRGIFIGWNRVESDLGRDDLWHDRGAPMLVDSVETMVFEDSSVRIIANIFWFSKIIDEGQRKVLIEEKRIIHIATQGDRLVIDHHSELRAARDLQLNGDLQHAGLHFRAEAAVDEVRDQTLYLWSPAEIPGGNGRIVSDQLEWVNFRFPLEGRWYSVTQLNHPENGTTELSWRDYGRFGFFRKASLKAGEALNFKARFWVEELAGPGDDSELRIRAENDYDAFKVSGIAIER
jgi:hypothetical protein